MNRRAVVLSSGGVDSTVCLAEAINTYGNKHVTSISVHYGQKHSKELKCAEALAEYYNIEHHVLDLSSVFQFCNSSLLEHSTEDIPEGSYVDQQGESETGIVDTYVPFRNGLMLSAVASFSMSLYPDTHVEIYLGNHSDDAAGNAYPDCSETFSSYINAAIFEGTGHYVKTYSPFASKHKADIVKRGLELEVPFEMTWSCYKGGDTACGVCGTCIDRIEAFKLNAAIDPIEYAIEDPFKELR